MKNRDNILNGQYEWLNGNKDAPVVEHPEVDEIMGKRKPIEITDRWRVNANNWSGQEITVLINDDSKEFYIVFEDGSRSCRYYLDEHSIDRQRMDDGSWFRSESWAVKGDDWSEDYIILNVSRLDWDEFGKDPWLASSGPELEVYREHDNLYVAAAQYIMMVV